MSDIDTEVTLRTRRAYPKPPRLLKDGKAWQEGFAGEGLLLEPIPTLSEPFGSYLAMRSLHRTEEVPGCGG
jgi:hypothetical protein